MRSWIQSEAQAYRRHQMALQSSRDGEQWRLNATSPNQAVAAAESKKPAKKAAKKESGAPKQGLTAFMFFSKAERPRVKSQIRRKSCSHSRVELHTINQLNRPLN